jgi:hypothetical protein
VALPYWPVGGDGSLDLSSLPQPFGAGLLAGRDKAPRSLSELIVASAINETLGSSQVYLNDGFLQLGGDSFGALELHARLLGTMGLSPGPLEILHARSARELARSLDSLIQEGGGPILGVRDGQGPSLALFPGLSGSLILYRELIADYPEGLGVLALNPFLERRLAPRLKNAAPPDQVGILVDEYARALHARFPEGDFILVGVGLKAVFAWETARIFEGIAGKGIRCLLMVDPISPGPGAPGEDEAGAVLDTLGHYEGFTPKRREARLEVLRLEVAAWRAYAPAELSSPVLSLRPSLAAPFPVLPAGSVPAPLQGLARGNFKEESVQADHYSLLLPGGATKALGLLREFAGI